APDAVQPIVVEPSPTNRQASANGEEPVPFVSDPALLRFATPEELGLPGRFERVKRPDLEPILSLGLAQSAARVTYSSPVTNEILFVDVLRLEDGVDAETFFASFADALVDNASFRGTRTVGVPRGVGELARHYAFRVEGDQAEAAAVLRGQIIALVKYRRPADLRVPLDVGALLRALDAALADG
ncbi:MAG: hypothetical protein V3V06_08245, partial [Dehalococcoidia bacterium]